MYRKSKRTLYVQLIFLPKIILVRYMEKYGIIRQVADRNITIPIKDAICMPE